MEDWSEADAIHASRCASAANIQGTPLEPTEVTFGLSPRYAIHTAREAHDWFLRMMHEHEEFEVETDESGEWPVPFCSETVRRVVVA